MDPDYGAIITDPGLPDAAEMAFTTVQVRVRDHQISDSEALHVGTNE